MLHLNLLLLFRQLPTLLIRMSETKSDHLTTPHDASIIPPWAGKDRLTSRPDQQYAHIQIHMAALVSPAVRRVGYQKKKSAVNKRYRGAGWTLVRELRLPASKLVSQ
jgi:hypothetical protein